jgi:hypothetical protein
VPDLGEATVRLRRIGLPIIREEPGIVVVEPGPLSGGVELAFTDQLLPNDPRSA